MFRRTHQGKSYIPLQTTITLLFLGLMIPVLLLFSLASYWFSSRALINDFELMQQYAENSVVYVLQNNDANLRLLEGMLDGQIDDAAKPFLAAYRNANGNPAAIDLDALNDEIGEVVGFDTDLYIIDRNGLIEYTTYEPDRGLDVSQWENFFSNLTKVRLGNEMQIDRISSETSTGELRKFAYIPTPDHNYILEIGISIDTLSEKMISLQPGTLIARITELNPMLTSVRTFDGKGYAFGVEDNPIVDAEQAEKTALNIFYNRLPSPYKVDIPNTPYQVRYVYVDLQDDAYASNVSWVVELTYDTTLIDEALQTQIIFTWGLSAAAIVATIALTLLVSNRIVNPIKSIVETVETMSEDLNARIDIDSGSELMILAESTNQMVARIQDYVTQLQAADTKLQRRERKYRELFENSHDIVFVANTDGSFTDMNPSGLHRLRYTLDEVRKMSLKALFVDQTHFDVFINQMAETGEVEEFTSRLHTRDGNVVVVVISASARAAERDSGELVYQGLIRDVTLQQKALQERMRLEVLEQEFSMARNIQQSLLQAPSSGWRVVDVACFSQPARVTGGDFYAFFEHPGELSLAVGDVSGKGMPAALMMSAGLVGLQSVVNDIRRPTDVLSRLDDVLENYAQANDQNCALIFARFFGDEPPMAHDPEKFDADKVEKRVKPNRMQVANAGNLMPLIIRADGSLAWLEVRGVPLGIGVAKDLTYNQLEVPLEAGDTVLFCTDGVSDMANRAGEHFGFARLEAAASRAVQEVPDAEGIVAWLRRDIETFVGGIDLSDDITMVVVRF